MTYTHLIPQVVRILEKSDEERIEFIRKDRWIGYSKAREILDLMDDLLIFPKRHRMPNLLIFGDTNNGKTMILRKFLELHSPDINLDGDAAIIPALMIQCPPSPDEARFYRAILDALSIPYRSREKVDNLQYQVIQVLRQVNTRILILDEIQHVLVGTQAKQHHFLNILKYISNELMLPLVAVGIQESLMVFRADPQLSNRFKAIGLPRWQLDTQFLRLLMSFEKVLPLKLPSNLTDRPIANKLLSMSDGLIGELAMVVSEAAITAIKAGTEQITLKILNELNWQSPSERKKVSERL